MTREDLETRLRNAVSAVTEGAVESVRKAAVQFDVPRTTLQRRMKGIQPHKTAHEPAERFSIEEEDSITRHILQMSVWGWPMTINSLETLVTAILRKNSDNEPLGRHWHSKFLARHPELKMLRSRPLDQSRKDASTYDILKRWFDLFQTARLCYNVADEDIYNMDEKGIMKGLGDNAKVIVSRHEKEAFAVQPGNREWVSIIECIGYNGYVPPPFVIFQGKQIQQAWIPEDSFDPHTVIQVSPNGWTDQEIALQWLKHFDHWTHSQVRGQYRMLVMDGHVSHVSLEFVTYCENHKIIPLCLPPHSTHILQPLDIGIFSPLAKAYKTRVSRNSVFGATYVSNAQFLQDYYKARLSIPSNIPSAWRAAGLLPFDPAKVLERFRPKTPPFASLTDRQGRRVDIAVDEHTGEQINALIASLLDVCSPSLQSQIPSFQHAYRAVVADNQCLQVMNKEVVEKAKKRRINKQRKNYGEARILTLQDMLDKKKQRDAEEDEKERLKAARIMQRSKVAFIKLAWQEMPVDTTVFSCELNGKARAKKRTAQNP